MRQRKYRETYRSRLSGWYNGYYHVFLILGVGLYEVYFAALHLHDVQWWEWLVVPAVFLFAQWVEYLFHRYLAHRPSKSAFWRLAYVRHTLMHHQFFTSEEPRFASHKDWRVTISSVRDRMHQVEFPRQGSFIQRLSNTLSRGGLSAR